MALIAASEVVSFALILCCGHSVCVFHLFGYEIMDFLRAIFLSIPILGIIEIYNALFKRTHAILMANG